MIVSVSYTHLELTLTLDKKEGDIFEEDIDIVPPVENPIRCV